MPTRCVNCYSPVDAGLAACPACGMTVVPTAPTPAVPVAPLPAVAPPDPAQTHTLAVLAAVAMPVVAAVFFAIVVGGVGFFVFRYVHFNRTRLAVPTPVVMSPGPAPAKPAQPKPPATSHPVPGRSNPGAPSPVSVSSRPVMPAPVPILTGFFPAVATPGTTLTLQGRGLKTVNQVLMVSAAGARRTEAKILAATDSVLAVQVPDVPFENDGIVIVVISPGGVGALIDQHTGVTPWGTDGRLQMTVVHVLAGDTIETHDGMVMAADANSTVSVGDNSVAFLADHVTLTGHGRNCRIFYVAPITLGKGVTRDGLTPVPAVNVADPTDLFRVKPDPAADQ